MVRNRTDQEEAVRFVVSYVVEAVICMKFVSNRQISVALGHPSIK
jgi:hypothetical protein